MSNLFVIYCIFTVWGWVKDNTLTYRDMFMASSKVYETKALIIPGEAGKHRACEKLLGVFLTALSGICHG